MICVHCGTELPEGSRFCTQCGADPSDPGSNPRAEQTGAASSLLGRLRDAVGDRYTIGKLLGRGGMGAVFLATDTTLDRPVAIKVLPPELSHDGKFVGRFEREARTAAKLDHPGIIPIYAVESHGDLYYFVMKFITGRSLDQILSGGPMPIDLVQRILWESAVALGHAHQRGVIHRDIKPANIMIDDGGRAMLTDFGISKAQQAATQFTATGQVIGTPHYMSPEQAKGLQVDGRSDEYSLGVVAYRMLTGRLPFADDSVHTVIYKQIFEDPEPIEELRPEVPPFLVTALKRAMAKDPKDRFPTMEDFASAVWPENPVSGPASTPAVGRTGPSVIDQAETQITPPTPPPVGARGAAAAAPAAAPKRRSPVFAIVAAVVLVGVGAGAWLVFFGGPAAREEAAVTAPPPLTEAAPATPAATDSQATESPPVQPRDTAPPPVTTPPASPPPRRATVPREPPPQQQQPPPVVRVGYLTVAADPFGTVTVDGVEVGDTPIAQHQVSPGRHVITVRREGYKTKVDTITVTAGETARRRYTLEREQP